MTSRTQLLTCYILGWIPMVLIAIGNGIIRELLYANYMSTLSAHQLSSITAILLFAVYTMFFHKQFPIDSKKNAVLIGSIWLTMTICFEFIFGHFIIGNSWEILLSDYNIFQGKLWSLVLVSIFLLPYTVYARNRVFK